MEINPAASPKKSLTRSIHRAKGRNNRGVITCRHRGGGHKRLYRIIDFHRNKVGIPAEVVSIEYESPTATPRISLLQYEDGEKRYILAPAGLAVGTTVVSGPDSPLEVGKRSAPLTKFPWVRSSITLK